MYDFTTLRSSRKRSDRQESVRNDVTLDDKSNSESVRCD